MNTELYVITSILAGWLILLGYYLRSIKKILIDRKEWKKFIPEIIDKILITVTLTNQNCLIRSKNKVSVNEIVNHVIPSFDAPKSAYGQSPFACQNGSVLQK